MISYGGFYDDLAKGNIERIRIVNDYFKGLYWDAILIKSEGKREALLYVSDLSDFLRNMETV